MNPADDNLKRLYILAPFFLLVLLLLFINLAPRLFVSRSGASPIPVPSVTPSPQPTAAITPSPPLPSPLPATPTPLPTATLPPDATIKLFGPPTDAVFSLNTPITFYWQWPLPLAEGQQFGVYLLVEEQFYRLGTVTEANLGLSYRLQTTLEPVAETAESAQWLVQLETTTAQPLLQSESRSIQLQTPP